MPGFDNVQMNMMSRIDPSLANVHWAATSKEPTFTGTNATPLLEYDLAVVGGGFCGLSIALHAAREGLSVVLLEAGSVGCGASGRNGGYAVPHFPSSVTTEDLYEVLGKDRAERLAALVAGGPTFVFDLIKELDIHCDPEQVGWIQPAHSEKSLAKVDRAFQSWRSRGINVEWLDADEVSRRTGAVGYIGGWFGKTGGLVNPYALVQGLARTATQFGAHIFENATVVGIDSSGAAKVVKTDRAEFTARKVVFATNAHTPHLYPGLDRSVIPVRLYHCITRPLTPEELRVTLPARTPFTDLRKSGGFARLTADNRLLPGGAVFVAGDQNYGYRHAKHRIAELFPHLRDIQIDQYWEGYCALTEASIPAIQELETNVYSVIGFSTRGVALAQTLGREMALLMAEKKTEAEMPVRVGPVQKIFLQPVKQFLGGYTFPVYKARDRLGLT